MDRCGNDILNPIPYGRDDIFDPIPHALPIPMYSRYYYMNNVFYHIHNRCDNGLDILKHTAYNYLNIFEYC